MLPPVLLPVERTNSGLVDPVEAPSMATFPPKTLSLYAPGFVVPIPMFVPFWNITELFSRLVFWNCGMYPAVAPVELRFPPLLALTVLRQFPPSMQMSLPEVTLMLPFTCSFAVGAVIPMPTRPASVTTKSGVSVPFSQASFVTTPKVASVPLLSESMPTQTFFFPTNPTLTLLSIVSLLKVREVPKPSSPQS